MSWTLRRVLLARMLRRGKQSLIAGALPQTHTQTLTMAALEAMCLYSCQKFTESDYDLFYSVILHITFEL